MNIKPRHKFHAKPTVSGGFRFDSKKEAAYYDDLVIARDHPDGGVLFFLRQVPFHLPGGVTLRLDYVVFRSDGTVDFVDVKGTRTKEYITKKKLVEALYPITIREV